MISVATDAIASNKIICVLHVKCEVNSALHPSGVAMSSTSFGWGKGWNVTSAGWQVTLCDPIWHVSSSSGVATLVSELLHPCYFTFFTARRNARIASAVLATAIPSVSLSVRPSVRLSVTRRYCVKTMHVARCSLHCQIAKSV